MQSEISNETRVAAPVRVQRRRSAGWQMPENTTYVGRGSRWGNPFKIGAKDNRTGAVMDASITVERFVNSLVTGRLSFTEADVRSALRGKNLACWCSSSSQCHADILLEIANV